MEGQLKESLPTPFPYFAEKETKGYLSSFCRWQQNGGLFSCLCRWGKAKGLAELPLR